MPYTSKQIQAMNTDELSRTLEYTAYSYGMQYRPTEDEIEALRWLGDRYYLSEYLLAQLDSYGSDGVLILTASSIGDALREDGVDRIPCMSDDCQLQRIVWMIGPTW